MKIFFSFFS